MSIILGINAYHSDSSACLIKSGKIVAAVEEERFKRIKHWSGLPIESIQFCFDAANIKLSDVDVIAFNQDSKANLLRKAEFMISKSPDISMILNRIKNKRERMGMIDELERIFSREKFKGKLFPVEHHYAHLASAFYASPYEHASIVSIDGFGDFASAAWGRGIKEKIYIDDKVYFPHSLGIFYMMMTQYIGFPNWGDEYKVMGLAPYGEPNYTDELNDIVLLQSDGSFKLNLKYFRHHSEKIENDIANGEPRVISLFTNQLNKLIGPPRSIGEELTQRHKDIARSTQVIYEGALFHLLNSIYQNQKLDSLALAGGCAMNSVANGKIYRHTPFKRIYVPSAAGDAGGAVGAALAAQAEFDAHSCRIGLSHAYLGPEFNDDDIGVLIKDKLVSQTNEPHFVHFFKNERDLLVKVAHAISEGLVIGWFQGKMEWGPRALGNRSILGDPRRENMKDILNLKIKRRESFRPFAPSILREHVNEWFEVNDEVPFMMQVYPIREHKRKMIPAVTHVDGSGRLQTVDVTANKRYYSLICEFNKITGVPIILNTSFNENEPVVCKPEEAIACFARTKMDILVMGNWLIQR